MGFSFHKKTGFMVTLTNNDKTAYRNNPHQEFNNALVMTSEPLADEELFEVRIDKKVSTWSGSIEIGVTNLNPTFLDFPSSATNLRDGSWVMSGSSIMENGKSILEDYGHDLDDLSEGDSVGVMRTRFGELHFFVNGIDHGVAAKNVPGFIYAVVDMYGKCAQVTIIEREYLTFGFTRPPDKLRFHEHCGTMVRLSNDNRSAERRTPIDEFNNGVVMTHRPLLDNELFEIRIDELVNKWSGSIEMGVTIHNPDNLEFPATMTNLTSGTIMMSGSGILTNGKGCRREYGEYNLDDLQEGDRIGLAIKSDRKLYYYINGYDQGIAAEIVPDVVFGVVDLYGMTVKVSLTDNIRPIVYPVMEMASSGHAPQKFGIRYDDLKFNPKCGRHVLVLNEGRTAYRPRCLDDFNNAVVITNRPLKPGEIFEVLLEQIVMKWAGTIEIGVTTHSAEDLDFPCTMTNVLSGTWMMTGNGIMHNGTAISDEYGSSLDKLKAGDRIGLIVYGDGVLRFFVNGIDLGISVSNIPKGVYGVIDLYGQAAKASIVSYADSEIFIEDMPLAAEPNYFEDLQMSQSSVSDERKNSAQSAKCDTDNINEIVKPQPYEPHAIYFDDEEDSWNDCNNEVELPFSFHPICGVYINLLHLRTIAYRKNSYNNGLVFSSSHIERNELYEIQLSTYRGDYTGCLRFGVTTYEPEDQESLPADVFSLANCDTWVISYIHLFKNGKEVNRNYALPFPFLEPPHTVGLKVLQDDSLHFYLNGNYMGLAAIDLPKKLRIVADVYGKCVSVIIPNEEVLSSADLKNIEKKSEMSITPVNANSALTLFHKIHCKNVELKNDNLSAVRIAGYNDGVLFSCKPLENEELFQVQIDEIEPDYSGCIQIGVTDLNPDQIKLPTSALHLKSNTWIISGHCVFHNGLPVRSEFCPDLNDIQKGYKIGVLLDSKHCLHVYLNNKDFGIAAVDITVPVYAVIDVYGKCKQVSISSDPYVPVELSNVEDKKSVDAQNNEQGVQKSLNSSPSSNICEMQKICAILKMNLRLYDTYFVPSGIVCYCKTCHNIEQEETSLKDCLNYCTQPFGWCCFPLVCSSKNEVNELDQWRVGYYAVNFRTLRKVLEQGSILPSVCSSLKSEKKSPGKSVKFDNNYVMISPSIVHAGSSKFAKAFEFLDSKTKEKYQAKASFKVFIRPGSFGTEHPQHGSPECFDDSSDAEWYIKDESSVVLHSLLLKVEHI
ncbi:neuralized-like protein 4 [Parasteatoda tepidariorum]|uniref:neuralized-like protein 4 n=1 Tax=Parasteatoda tepidariorum TaxID=114398 RepID=UPI00077FB049|nr:neuralized-like protein 4 [Parasteatoda tepidariorum]